MGLEHARVVLVQTHFPGNLGATARVMRNLGFTDLVLVSPGADPADPAARQMSTHGESILQKARIVQEVGDAIKDCVLVVGTSARTGGLFRRQTVGLPEEIMPHLVEIIQQDRPTALLFGPEPTGLSNAVVTRCQYLVQIPTADDYPALNLAQAVAICLYELRKAWLKTSPPAAPKDLASVYAREHLFGQLEIALEEIHFLYGDKADALMHAVRHLLGKAHLSNMEVRILLGLARQIRWYVANHPENPQANP